MAPNDCAVTGTGLNGKGIDTNASTPVIVANSAILVNEYTLVFSILLVCSIVPCSSIVECANICGAGILREDLDHPVQPSDSTAAGFSLQDVGVDVPVTEALV